jgi:hypothetical protein
MPNKFNMITALITALFLIGNQGVYAKSAGTKDAHSVGNTTVKTKELWAAPADISSRNLFYGPGGKSHQPGKTFTFIKEDLHGTNPKFDVRDENGVRWKAKLGVESQPETAASRLLWAVGYHADEDYFVDTLQLRGVPEHLRRAHDLIAPDGTVYHLRLKRDEKDRKKIGNWSWRNGPFTGTREWNGLRVLMALINNWDLKDENNAIYEEHGNRIYEVSDLGASFGTPGVLVSKIVAKGNLSSFETSKFITKVTPEHVDFATPSLPSPLYVFNPWQYGRRARLRWIGRDIDRADARWIGQLLGQLSTSQLRDAFRAAGYSQVDVTAFVQALQKRIEQLKAL